MTNYTLDDILPFVEKPSRYLGSEINSIKKDADSTKLRIALAFPDLYEIGTSHFGLQILYHILNSQADIAAERVFAPAVDMWNRLMERARQVGAKKEFVENKPENPHINYSRNPISGVVEVDRLMDDLEPRLGDLNVPALVVQSRGDPVVDPKGSRKIFELIGSSDKEYLLFNFDRHGILLGEGAQKVHRAIGEFIKRF